MNHRRLLELIGILMIGDGVVAVIDPRRHGLLWLAGPSLWRQTMMPFVRHPALMRSVGLAEALAGLWLARQQQPDGAVTRHSKTSWKRR